MHEFWIISYANMMYTRWQNYTNTLVGEHGIHNIRTCGCCVVVLDVIVSCFCAHKCTPLIILDMWFVLVY